ncbi:hypothetical protein EAF04_003509 [Stromatinia cepivora]|nr:hypothetical protein EAF04_003509 [Stromatinia cepivora]
MFSSIKVSLIYIGGAQAASLYNGLHASILSPDISAACDAAFNTELNCESLIQLTPYSIQSTKWNTSSLTSLCTASCQTGLASLTSLSETACADDTFSIDSNVMSLHELVDMIEYKWGLICLQDETTDEFCLDVEDSWNITTMVALDGATWPKNTQKCYLGSSEGYWEHYTGDNDTCIEPEWTTLESVFETSGRDQMSAMDYYTDAPDPIDDDNYGWPEVLDFDEYPLEIQCSSCFLQRFKVGYESTWGNSWDEVTEQVWANMKQNCGFNENIAPAHNVSGVINIGDDVAPLPPVTTECPQNITISGEEQYTCHEAFVKFKIPTAGLFNLDNSLYCSGLSNTTLCAPMSCPILVVNTGGTSFADVNVPVASFVRDYTNSTLTDFYSYNSYLSYGFVSQNDTVCIGPPNQIYQPSL